jgi:hypothetical protein
MDDRANDITVASTTEIVIGNRHFIRYNLILNPFTFFKVISLTGRPIKVIINATTYGVYAGHPTYNKTVEIAN